MKQSILFVLFVISWHSHLFSILGSTLSCNAPTIINKTTTVTLDADIIIDQVCELVTAGPNFGLAQEASVIFTASQPRKVIVTKNGIWNMSSFNTQQKIIKFAGKALLQLEKGSQLVFDGGKLVISENAQIITVDQDAA